MFIPNTTLQEVFIRIYQIDVMNSLTREEKLTIEVVIPDITFTTRLIGKRMKMTHIDQFNESYRDLYSKLNRWILEGSIVQFPHFEEERFIKNHWKNFQVNRDFDEPLKECLEFMVKEIKQDLNYTFSELVRSLLREINNKSESVS